MPSRPLFLYGTLRDPDILLAVLGRATPPADLHPATAPGFAALYYPGRVYPALVPRLGAEAPGLLLTALSSSDIDLLDAFEGTEYRRLPIAIRIDEADMAADAYLPDIAIGEDAQPWTLEAWTARHKAQVLAAETATAHALRQRLFVQDPTIHH